MREDLNRRGSGWSWACAVRRAAAACALCMLLVACDPAAQGPLATPTPPDPSPLPRSPAPTGTPAGRTFLPSVAGPPPTRATYLPSIQQRPSSGTPLYLPAVRR